MRPGKCEVDMDAPTTVERKHPGLSVARPQHAPTDDIRPYGSPRS